MGTNILGHSKGSSSSPSLSLTPCHPLSCLPSTQCKSSFAILQLLQRNVNPYISSGPAQRFIKQQKQASAKG